MLVNDWGGGQQLEDDGKEEVLPPLEVFSLLEETKTVNSNFDFKEKDQKKAQETNAKAEMITPENLFIDNNDKAGPFSLEKGKTVNSNMDNQMENALDETLIESQKSDSKTEMETGNPVFDNNDSGKGEIPSTLDEGKTGNVKRKRIRCIKRGILWKTPKWILDFLF